uniref:acetyl-CoA carboxylase carboxyltransferase beta subunit n=1 Tax=Medicago murex TaxID=75627 RepID=UPI00226CFB43|nr:acetyl-CoA carboxylase carboxyltransferase beta subunit [Medicago murex]UZC30536.1 acetyl-CoA carboxylase carboxyltransferase beta subunit [Medicago murex]UZC30612.1 acetyl-CoA carboxylase carboxyltransferase beta subunit [Medicago murex]
MGEKNLFCMEKQKTRAYSLGYIIDYGYRYVWDYIIDRWYNIFYNWPTTIIHEYIQQYFNYKFGIDINFINFLFFDKSYNDKAKDCDCDWDSDRARDWDCDCDKDKDKDWDCDKDWDWDKLQKDREMEIYSTNEDDKVQKDSSVLGTENDNINQKEKFHKDSSVLGTENDNNQKEKFHKDSSSVLETENDNNNETDKVQKDSSVLETETETETENDKVQKDSSVLETENDKVQKDSEMKSTDIYPTDFSHLWVMCDECYGMNYKKYFKAKMNICEYCDAHLKMSSSDRIDLLIDPGTWNPMDEDMVSIDPIEFNSEKSLDSSENDDYPNSSEDEPSENDDYPNSLEDEDEDEPSENSSEDEDEDEPSENDDYPNRLDSNQDNTGLLEAVQTGTGELNGIPVAIGIMDFEFMGGSMGSVVGEKITRLIEYATDQLLPLIIVCASGGARMQEGSLSLMQMAKISSALYNYQINKKLFYITILTSPTTGGITASFGMLGDVVIAEPNAYIAFAGKRVIEETLKIEVPEGVQTAEFLFEKGAFDSIVPRNSLKEVLSELYHFHGIFPLTETEQ